MENPVPYCGIDVNQMLAQLLDKWSGTNRIEIHGNSKSREPVMNPVIHFEMPAEDRKPVETVATAARW